jgi:NADPH:quinone reductase-like Zn-dependent oxidoreductase
MKEAIVHPTPELHTTIHEVPIPEPGPDELVIKVIVAGSNPKGLSYTPLPRINPLIDRQIGTTSRR